MIVFSSGSEVTDSTPWPLLIVGVILYTTSSSPKAYVAYVACIKYYRGPCHIGFRRMGRECGEV
jgi:hypothetical protein